MPRFEGAVILVTPVVHAEQSGSPATPSSGFAKAYAKADGLPYWMGDDGIERPLIEVPSAIHLNPSFDAVTGGVPDNWNLFWVNAPATVAIDSTDKYVGANSLKIMSSTGSANVLSSVFAVAEGSLVTFTWWGKAGTAGHQIICNLLCDAAGNGDPNLLDGTSVWANQGSSAVTLSTTWVKYTNSFLIPANQVTGRFNFGTATANETVWIDETSSSIQLAVASPSIVGEIKMWPLASEPAGYLICNGQSTTGYPALAALVGATVPDLRGVFPLGVLTGTYNINTAGGLAQHTHDRGNHTHTDNFANGTVAHTGATNRPGGGSLDVIANIGGTTSGTHTHTKTGGVTTSGSGNTGNASDGLPPYKTVNFIIKT
jgi:microcystin-dependent protein